MKLSVRLLTLLAVLAVSVFGAARPALAAPAVAPPGPPPDCIFPWFPNLEKIIFGPNPPFPLYNGILYDMNCGLFGGIGFNTPVESGQPGTVDLYNGWVSATIYAIPGVSFKAFMYQVVPQPKNVPEGWNILGYGVDIFYDNGEVNPSGYVCWSLPAGLYGNFELGVYQYLDGSFHWLSNTACGSFDGGGQFFLLTKAIPENYYLPWLGPPPP